MKPYSLRRGGATHLLQTGVPLDVILVRGRWRSLGVARLYLEDGLAQIPKLRMSPLDQARLHTYAAQCPTTAFHHWLKSRVRDRGIQCEQSRLCTVHAFFGQTERSRARDSHAFWEIILLCLKSLQKGHATWPSECENSKIESIKILAKPDIQKTLRFSTKEKTDWVLYIYIYIYIYLYVYIIYIYIYIYIIMIIWLFQRRFGDDWSVTAGSCTV